MHKEIEEYLEASGLAWTHLRPTGFMQEYLREAPSIVKEGALYLALADLGGSTASINSALQRSRETLAKRYPNDDRSAALPPNPAQQELLGRYMQAWEKLELDCFVSLLKEDATYTMPPLPQRYAGREAIGTSFGWAWKQYDSFRLVPTVANQQPAFAAYSRACSAAPWAAHSIHVLSLEQSTISRLTLFAKPVGPRLFDAFGLPPTLTAPSSCASQ